MGILNILKTRTSSETGFKIELLTFSLITLSGCMYKDPKLFYTNAMYIFVAICLFTFGTEIFFLLLGRTLGKVVQQANPKPPKYKQEILLSLNCFFLVAMMVAWPYTRYTQGEVISYVPTLKETVVGDSILLNISYILGMTIFVDFFTYWKHSLLHEPICMTFHELHHSFHTPTVFTSFAVGPVEAFFTFGLIYVQAFKFSELFQFYLPLHLTFLLSQVVLNVYLHCGYKFDIIESTLPYIMINTSAFHNNHHEKTYTHLSELCLFWDYIMNTGPTKYNTKQFEEKMALKAAKRKNA